MSGELRLAAHGLKAKLPPGWEGSIRADRAPNDNAQVFAVPDEDDRVYPVAHFATFALPPTRDDFGAQAVVEMSTGDAFVTLVEYEPEEADSPLFANKGLPRKLDPRSFSRRQLQRTLAGQAGFQWFFNEGGRAFCLYVVLGDETDAYRLVRKVEQVLSTIVIEARA